MATMENLAHFKPVGNSDRYHPETWPRKPDGKIDYDAWIDRIMALWPDTPQQKRTLNRKLYKIF